MAGFEMVAPSVSYLILAEAHMFWLPKLPDFGSFWRTVQQLCTADKGRFLAPSKQADQGREMMNHLWLEFGIGTATCFTSPHPSFLSILGYICICCPAFSASFGCGIFARSHQHQSDGSQSSAKEQWIQRRRRPRSLGGRSRSQRHLLPRGVFAGNGGNAVFADRAAPAGHLWEGRILAELMPSFQNLLQQQHLGVDCLTGYNYKELLNSQMNKKISETHFCRDCQ